MENVLNWIAHNKWFLGVVGTFLTVFRSHAKASTLSTAERWSRAAFQQLWAVEGANVLPAKADAFIGRVVKLAIELADASGIDLTSPSNDSRLRLAAHEELGHAVAVRSGAPPKPSYPIGGPFPFGG